MRYNLDIKKGENAVRKLCNGMYTALHFPFPFPFPFRFPCFSISVFSTYPMLSICGDGRLSYLLQQISEN